MMIGAGRRLGLLSIAFVALMGLAFPSLLGRAGAGPRDYASIAAYWAPVILQDVDRPFRHDYLTHFAYDNDWEGGNNERNASAFDLPSHIYYWVQETSSHYFIGYGLYYVAGQERGREYENDLRGLLIAVEKSARPEAPLGEFAALLVRVADGLSVSLAQSSRVRDAGLEAIWRAHTTPSRRLRARESTSLGAPDLDFVLDKQGFHPVIYVTAQEHRIWTKGAGSLRPRLFEDDGVTDWRAPPWERGERGAPQATRGRSSGPAGRRYPSGDIPRYLNLRQFGVVYRYAGSPEVVASRNVHGQGRLGHHWEVVTYDLLSIRPLWDRRTDHTQRGLLFQENGVFAGAGSRGPGTRAPWAWGPLFLSPARLLGELLEGAESMREEVVSWSFASLEEMGLAVAAGHVR